MTRDLYQDVQEATRRHRQHHGCGAYTYSDGSLPGVIAAAMDARRIVEVGTALGYTALWLAHHHRDTEVDTIESDPDHVQLARQQIDSHGRSRSITVHAGRAEQILTSLPLGQYDMAFFDGFSPTADLIHQLRELLRPGGVLLSANLTLGGAQEALSRLADPTQWLTHSFGETALAVKLPT